MTLLEVRFYYSRNTLRNIINVELLKNFILFFFDADFA